MQRVLITLKNHQKDEMIHILEVNNYRSKTFTNADDVILVLELCDCQMNLLIQLVHDFMKSQDDPLTISVCHQISFYD